VEGGGRKGSGTGSRLNKCWCAGADFVNFGIVNSIL
jgi:hypothetical protein